ncbi:serine hydrolase [Sphingomicrobium flavum]|uniref:serine hydrolase n=1 Tax=Sphingomicrobium flavum TaxID=1229164 RepID=UPI0021ADECE5|nr:serine hydrolase [Sphingomicrobium flavum]
MAFAASLVVAPVATASTTLQPVTPAAANLDAFAPMQPAADADVAQLNAQIHERVRTFQGLSGIAVKAIDRGWEAGWRADRLFPQQSVSKLWVSLAALDLSDQGKLDLNRRVTLDRNDITIWSRGTTAKILAGGYTKSLDELLYDALVKSDNHANDRLLREVGGPEAIRGMITSKGLGPIRFSEGERIMQSKIAGFAWDQSLATGNRWNEARARVPAAQRSAAFNHYVADPYDGAAPIAIARALARLEQGELLSPAATAKFLTTMGMATTGRLRIKSGLKPGWSWAHKTGTGQVYAGRVAGVNDVGILTAPDGTGYAIAILTVSDGGQPGAQALMRDVARMVIDHHERHEGRAYTL